MDKTNSPITTIHGISYTMGVMIISEIGDFNSFDSPDKTPIVNDTRQGVAVNYISGTLPETA